MKFGMIISGTVGRLIETVISYANLCLILNDIRESLMNKKVCAGSFLCGIVASSLAMADCPNTMPVQLLTDCIVDEGAGHDFPPSGYANMGMYQDWVKAEQAEHTNALAKSEIK